MSYFGRLDTNGVVNARHITEAVEAFNQECATCLRHGCRNECPLNRALHVNILKNKDEMKDPEIRRLVELTLEGA